MCVCAHTCVCTQVGMYAYLLRRDVNSSSFGKRSMRAAFYFCIPYWPSQLNTRRCIIIFRIRKKSFHLEKYAKATSSHLWTQATNGRWHHICRLLWWSTWQDHHAQLLGQMPTQVTVKLFFRMTLTFRSSGKADQLCYVAGLPHPISWRPYE